MRYLAEMNIKTPLLAVDYIIFRDNAPLLIKRKNEPFKNRYALPGGFVNVGETIEQACKREMLEETSVKVSKLKLVGIYSNPKRDPRGHVASVVFLGKAENAKPKAASDAASAEFVEEWQKEMLAFDHKKIIKDALKVNKNNQ